MKAERVELRRATVYIAATPEQFPLGARGERPVRFAFHAPADMELFREAVPAENGGLFYRPRIPGTLFRGGALHCAWDAAVVVADRLGELLILQNALNTRLSCKIPLPGLARYKALGIDKKRREYQQEDILFCIRRAYSILGEPPRAGKCFVTLATWVLDGGERLLILCQMKGKYVWAEECATWLNEPAAILYGRGGSEVRVFCVACKGKRQVDNPDVLDLDGLPTPEPCKACWDAKKKRSLGEKVYLARSLEPVVSTRQYETPPTEKQLARYQEKCEAWEEKDAQRRMEHELKNASKPEAKRKAYKPLKEPDAPLPATDVARFVGLPAVFRCRAHPDEVDSRRRKCTQCKAQVVDALKTCRIHISNWHILGDHRQTKDNGGLLVRRDLPGWAQTLAKFEYSTCGIDEIHFLRGVKHSRAQEDKKIREQVSDLVDPIPRVIGITGTLFYGFVRDAWSPLDIVSGGLWS